MRERIAFDRKSQRTFDANGFLHVAMSPISKEAVNDYYGHEIPNWQKLGLDPNRIYKGYRPADELQKAVVTFNGLNILSEHIKDGAEDPPKDYIIGSMGTDANFATPYLRNSLIIKDAKAIELLSPADPEAMPKREISASYRYDPVFKAGTFDNQRYDFIMTNIRGNHIALVEEGRAGSDVVVSDQNTVNMKRGKSMNPLKIIEDLIASLKASGIAPHEGGEEEAKKFMEEGGTPAATDNDPEKQPEGANDDALEAALTELFALADSVADEELAAKLKNVGEAIRASQGQADDEDETDPAKKVAEDEDDPAKPVGDNEEGKPAMDKKPKMKKVVTKSGGNTYNISLPLAMDAASITRSVEAKINAKIAAVRECRPLIGDVDPMAFDSAAGVYRKALEVAGRPTKVTDVMALREMVQLACDAKPKDYIYPSVSSAFANDSKGKEDPNFAGLGRIRRA